MKKAISSILALAICLFLCACAAEKPLPSDSSTPLQSDPAEHISCDALFTDLENEARAQMRVGKETTVFGRITAVKVDHCVIELMKPKNQSIMVSLDTEALARFEIGSFTAITGIVAAFSPQSEYIWRIQGTRIEDRETMHSIFLEHLEKLDLSNHPTYDGIHGTYRFDFLVSYLAFAKNEFIITDNAALKTYLTGTWIVRYYEDENLTRPKDYPVQLKDNGEFTVDFFPIHAMDFKWSVANGKLDALFAPDPEYVYVLSDNVCIHAEKILIRQN